MKKNKSLDIFVTILIISFIYFFLFCAGSSSPKHNNMPARRWSYKWCISMFYINFSLYFKLNCLWKASHSLLIFLLEYWYSLKRNNTTCSNSSWELIFSNWCERSKLKENFCLLNLFIIIIFSDRIPFRFMFQKHPQCMILPP